MTMDAALIVFVVGFGVVALIVASLALRAARAIEDFIKRWRLF